MAGTEWQVSTTPIASTASEKEAATIDAHATIGFILNRISVSIQNLGSETGKSLIEVVKHDGASTGTTALTPIAIGGDSDAISAAGFEVTGGALGGMATKLVIAARYWPITSQSSCVFDFGQLLGRPLKIKGGDGVLVRFTGPTGATTSLYTITFAGEE